MAVPGKRLKDDEAPADGYRLEEQVGFLLRKAHQAATEAFQATVGDIDVTPRQFSVMVTLLQGGEVSLSRLGELTAMDPATLLGVTRRLARRGLVAVRSDPTDRRRRLAQLTRSGHDLGRELIEIGPRISERILDPFTPDERRTVLRLLERLGNRKGPEPSSRNRSKPGA